MTHVVACRGRLECHKRGEEHARTGEQHKREGDLRRRKQPQATIRAWRDSNAAARQA
jgi:hypothetical protein